MEYMTLKTFFGRLRLPYLIHQNVFKSVYLPSSVFILGIVNIIYFGNPVRDTRKTNVSRVVV